MKKLFALLVCLYGSVSFAQNKTLIRIDSDSTNVSLTKNGASFLASLPLKCVQQEFPNKTSHISNNADEHKRLPSDLHPSFYGCFDWHSSVHGHWMLIKLLKLYPDLPEAASIRAALNKNLTQENLLAEAAYFNLENTRNWERTYGWAWLLNLDAELYTWDDADAKRWHKNLQPLTQKIVQLWTDFLPKQTYPNRTGVHPNTAFGLVFALDFAQARNFTNFEKTIKLAAVNLFSTDRDVPAIWEPNGSDFLSPSLEEADLMRRVLSKEDFVIWRDKFFPSGALEHLSVLPIVSDRSDLQIVHLDGLCFSRSWCMQALADTYPNTHPYYKLLKKAAFLHLNTALEEIASGQYSGEHWLASFAVYALTFNR
jgi:hypothetical protein